MKEELLAKLCDNLQKSLQDQSQIVKYFVGVKPSNYFIASMHIGITASIPTETPVSMFAEIWLDDTCVFRESISNRENVYGSQHKEDVIERLMTSVFSFGVFASYKSIENAGYYGR